MSDNCPYCGAERSLQENRDFFEVLRNYYKVLPKVKEAEECPTLTEEQAKAAWIQCKNILMFATHEKFFVQHNIQVEDIIRTVLKMMSNGN